VWESLIVFVQEAAAQEGGGGGQGAPPGPSFSSSIFFMLIIFGVMYLFLILPNQRREKQRREMLSSLSKGDEVITSGGMYGTIVGLNEKTVTLRVSDDPVTKIEFVRGAVSQVTSTEDNPGKESKKK